MHASAKSVNPWTTARNVGPLANALARARNCSPVIDRTLRDYGDISIRDYGRTLLRPPPPALQSSDDFIQVIREMTAELFDVKTAETLAANLQNNPVALTANHHGVDYFAQSVQGSLIFALLQQGRYGGGNTALVLSCGNIPLDNITYPQGMLLYGINDSIDVAPRKMPIFSNKLRRWIVSVSPGYTDAMIKRAAKTAADFQKDNIISSKTLQCIETLFAEDYMDPAISNLPDYSRQATLLNHRIWNRLHAGRPHVPRLISLELEKVASRLVLSDLTNRQSLISSVLFDRCLRGEVFKALEGHRACWRHSAESAQNVLPSSDPTVPQRGTHFFWGVTENGRKFPLVIDRNDGNTVVLRGVDNKCHRVEFPFEPDSLASLIQTNQLVPSIFTCFLAISFARGINCIGGYYQADYLPQMQAGLIRALKQASADPGIAETIGRIPTSGYLSGMQTVMIPWEKDSLIPAGPLEIMAGNGLTDLDTQKILAMSVKSAHLASLFETIPDIAPLETATPGWKHSLARDCYKSLSDSIVIK